MRDPCASERPAHEPFVASLPKDVGTVEDGDCSLQVLQEADAGVKAPRVDSAETNVDVEGEPPGVQRAAGDQVETESDWIQDDEFDAASLRGPGQALHLPRAVFVFGDDANPLPHVTTILSDRAS